MAKRQIDTEVKEERMIREIRVSDLRKYYLYPLIALLFLICGQVIAGIFLKHPYHLIAYGCAVVPEYYLLKNHAIGCVLMYKAFAPMETRERCRFEPTCSTYMIIAIKKYGLFIGVIKGLRRIFRCKPPNGGIDYP